MSMSMLRGAIQRDNFTATTITILITVCVKLAWIAIQRAPRDFGGLGLLEGVDAAISVDCVYMFAWREKEVISSVATIRIHYIDEASFKDASVVIERTHASSAALLCDLASPEKALISAAIPAPRKSNKLRRVHSSY